VILFTRIYSDLNSPVSWSFHAVSVSVQAYLVNVHLYETTVRGKTGLIVSIILFPSGATCPSVDICFSELILYKESTKRLILVQSRHYLVKNKLF